MKRRAENVSQWRITSPICNYSNRKIDGVMSTLHPHRINITTDRCAIGKECLALEKVIAGSYVAGVHISSWMNFFVRAMMILPANFCGVPLTTIISRWKNHQEPFMTQKVGVGRQPQLSFKGLPLFFWCRCFSATSSQLLPFPLVLLCLLPCNGLD